MSLLHAWVDTPLAGAAGWTLLHSLWQGAIAAAALAAVRLTFRSPRIRYAAGCLALLSILGAAGVTLSRRLPGASTVAAARTQAFPPWIDGSAEGAGSPDDSALAAFVPWLAPFWGLGTAAFYLWHGAAWISVLRLRRRGVCLAPEHWQTRLADLCSSLRLSRPVALLESSLADAPLVLGHFRPLILMPVGVLAGLPQGQVEAILLHELAHIRRSDYLANLLQRLIEGLFFYHPAVWWISRVVRAEREHCCDDTVVAIHGNTHEYASALGALERNRWSGREPTVAAAGGNLVKRIRRLLYPQKSNAAWSPFFAALILIVAGAVALTAWQAPVPRTGSASGEPATPYSRWLNEEVVYIIADEEHAAFERLATDEERAKFIEQFWLRRDPTPNTPDNEFKNEHYRRIAYANARFRTESGRPGWQTDRGHVYIVYGAPDELEDHPAAGPQAPYAMQAWLYRHIEGVGDRRVVSFVDRTGRGDYRLVPTGIR